MTIATIDIPAKKTAPGQMTNGLPAMQFKRSLRCLLDGGVLACPTETVYGLSCMAWEKDAVERILQLKRRSARKNGLIVVAAEQGHIKDWIDLPESILAGTIKQSRNEPITWVFPATRDLPPWLCGAGNTIAIRISAHPLLQALCRHAGPIVSTSANPANRPPARDSRRVRSYFGTRVDYIHPGRTLPDAKPSQIRLAENGTVLRK